MNRRNSKCILQHNPRSRIQLVDDKLLMAELCGRIGVATPQIFAVISAHAELCSLSSIIADHREWVIKAARGSGGRGLMVIVDRDGNRLQQANGRWMGMSDLRAHLSDMLTGLFSIGGQQDCVLLQKRIRAHPVFEPIAPRGLPDIRVLLYRFEPIMAMLRLPTFASNGRANLHQGGIGVGVDLATGRTVHAMLGETAIDRHPDTGSPILGWSIPYWGAILDMARRTARAVGLGYVGMDIVIDDEEGPLLLEANARPGLAVQLANGAGLRHRMTEIDEQLNGRKGTDLR